MSINQQPGTGSLSNGSQQGDPRDGATRVGEEDDRPGEEDDRVGEEDDRPGEEDDRPGEEDDRD